MPPFRQSMSNADLAAVLTFIRNSWGNAAGPVSELDAVHAR
jgi:mono/diheme cytochrome c family protein